MILAFRTDKPEAEIYLYSTRKEKLGVEVGLTGIFPKIFTLKSKKYSLATATIRI